MNDISKSRFELLRMMNYNFAMRGISNLDLEVSIIHGHWTEL